MNIHNPPRAIHGKAIELACNSDRVWFEQNPDRVHRVRDMIPFENNGPMELPPYGMTWRVVVLQIKSGMRFRLVLALPDELPNEAVDEKRLAEILKRPAPFPVKKVWKAVLKERRKAKRPEPQS